MGNHQDYLNKVQAEHCRVKADFPWSQPEVIEAQRSLASTPVLELAATGRKLKTEIVAAQDFPKVKERQARLSEKTLKRWDVLYGRFQGDIARLEQAGRDVQRVSVLRSVGVVLPFFAGISSAVWANYGTSAVMMGFAACGHFFLNRMMVPRVDRYFQEHLVSRRHEMVKGRLLDRLTDLCLDPKWSIGPSNPLIKKHETHKTALRERIAATATRKATLVPLPLP